MPHLTCLLQPLLIFKNTNLFISISYNDNAPQIVLDSYTVLQVNRACDSFLRSCRSLYHESRIRLAVLIRYSCRAKFSFWTSCFLVDYLTFRSSCLFWHCYEGTRLYELKTFSAFWPIACSSNARIHCSHKERLLRMLNMRSVVAAAIWSASALSNFWTAFASLP